MIVKISYIRVFVLTLLILVFLSLFSLVLLSWLGIETNSISDFIWSIKHLLFLSTVITLLFFAQNIEISEDRKTIETTSRFAQLSVSQENIDCERSQNTSWLTRILGQYRIVKKNGRVLHFNRYLFPKEEFRMIQWKYRKIFGVELP